MSARPTRPATPEMDAFYAKFGNGPRWNDYPDGTHNVQEVDECYEMLSAMIYGPNAANAGRPTPEERADYEPFPNPAEWEVIHQYLKALSVWSANPFPVPPPAVVETPAPAPVPTPLPPASHPIAAQVAEIDKVIPPTHRHWWDAILAFLADSLTHND